MAYIYAFINSSYVACIEEVDIALNFDNGPEMEYRLLQLLSFNNPYVPHMFVQNLTGKTVDSIVTQKFETKIKSTANNKVEVLPISERQIIQQYTTQKFGSPPRELFSENLFTMVIRHRKIKTLLQLEQFCEDNKIALTYNEMYANLAVSIAGKTIQTGKLLADIFVPFK